jgi:hypothetical protein
MSARDLHAGGLTSQELARIAYAAMIEDGLKGDKWSAIQVEVLKRFEELVNQH